MNFWIVDKILPYQSPTRAPPSLSLPFGVLGTVNAFQRDIVCRNLITKLQRIGDIAFICAATNRSTE